MARMLASKYSRIGRPCARRLSLNVSIRSAKRLPASLIDP